jgi:phosphonoacetaldehyde hydrolase
MRLEAVIFDWAGTVIDHGSLAPVRAVSELFARRGVPVREQDIRRDMGLFKKDHIRRLLQAPEVSAAFSAKTGRKPDERDVEEMFGEFGPLQMEILDEYSQLISGVPQTTDHVRRLGLRLGSTTGYTRPMLDRLVSRAALQGYRPEVSLCPDDVGGGRPQPWMCFRLALHFRLSSVAAAVKVGDTVSDIQEGLNAGMWTVGVSDTGNEIGLSEADWAALTVEDRKRRSAAAGENLRATGAHYVIESVSGLTPILEDIERRLGAGERP